MKRIKRRDFIKQAASGIGSVLLAKSLRSNVSLAQTPSDMSRVVVVKHPGATDSTKVINSTNVQAMVDESIKQLTDNPSVVEAWASILPNFKKEHIIAIKVNPLGMMLPTHPEIVNAITIGLTSAGAHENNIIIYDRTNSELNASGYIHNTSNVGVRCFGTDEEGWGYDWNNPVDILGQKRALSTIVTRCDHLINVPVLKVHLDWYGVTLSLKNHYGSVDSPQLLHDNFAEACAILNSQKNIKDKTRLVIIDALFGCWGSNPSTWVIDFTPNSLIVSKDPVSADYVGTKMLNEERAKHDQPQRRVPLLEKAAQMGLGINDPQKIELRAMELKS